MVALVALYLAGVWIGWRISKLKPGEVFIPTHGFGRGTPKPLRVGTGAFGTAAIGVGVGVVATQLDSQLLYYLAVAIVGASISVGHGALMGGCAQFCGKRQL